MKPIFPNLNIFKKNKDRYLVLDYLKRNKIEGDIMYVAAKRLDNEVNIPKEVGHDFEENFNFEKNIICLYKTKTDYEKSLITDAFNRGLPVEDKDNFFVKYGCHSIWKLFEAIANMNKDEIMLLVKSPVKEVNEVFAEIDGVMRIQPKYVYGSLSIQDGKVNLVKNGTPQISEIIEKQTR